MLIYDKHEPESQSEVYIENQWKNSPCESLKLKFESSDGYFIAAHHYEWLVREGDTTISVRRKQKKRKHNKGLLPAEPSVYSEVDYPTFVHTP